MKQYGVCSTCTREMHVRLDGNLRRHRDLITNENCPGTGTPPIDGPPTPHIAELDDRTSKWLRIAANNLGITLSEATAYAICLWLSLPLPAAHPLADEHPKSLLILAQGLVDSILDSHYGGMTREAIATDLGGRLLRGGLTP